MEEILLSFRERLLQENEKQNLISRKTALSEVDKHILDSLALRQFVSLAGEKVIDIGSGAGFPGLVLGLVSRETSVTLLESDLRKSIFLADTAAALSSENITVVRERAEILGQNPKYREHYTLCTSRAVASTRILLEYALPLLTGGGRLYLWKGPKYEKELDEATNALKILGGAFEKAHHYTLEDGEERYLVQIKKIQQTPAKYPRKNGIPAKRPL